MEILGALLVHDKRKNTFYDVVNCAKNLPIELKTFSFSDQEISKECDYIFERPVYDRAKITCSYLSLATGMRESELMQLSWLRNKALEIAKSYDAILFIDADVLLPENTIERLLKCKSDISMGWYFHKRLGTFPIKYEGVFDEKDIIKKSIKKCITGGNGCVLMKKDIIETLRYDLYNGIKAEDSVFYRKALDSGFTIKVDLGLYCKHIGNDWSPMALKFKEEKTRLWKLK